MKQQGLVLKSNGGLYEIATENGRISCKARGVFRHEGVKVLVGDRVLLSEGENEQVGIQIDTVLERSSCLNRPPMANLNVLFVVIAAARPAPILSTVDRLLAITEDAGVKTAILITKSDLDPEGAERMAAIYRSCGYDAMAVSAKVDGAQTCQKTREWIASIIKDGIAAFAGASGVGKSSLLRAVFPEFEASDKSALAVGGLSKKTDRGRQTTRIVQLFPLPGGGYLADTPGFSVLDYMNQTELTKENLPLAFREFEPCLGHCRYTGCTHRKEEGCAILEAVREGRISESRHESYRIMYEELKDKHPWD